MASKKYSTVRLDGESLIESSKLHRLHGKKLVGHKVSSENAGTYSLMFEDGTILVFTADGDLSATCSMEVRR